MNKKILMALLIMNSLGYSMGRCTGGNKPKPEWVQQKSHLMKLIENSDLQGIKQFTQTSNVQYIDAEAIQKAKAKFEASKTNDPAQFSMNNQFLIMTLVQALAPVEVKQKLGLPH